MLSGAGAVFATDVSADVYILSLTGITHILMYFNAISNFHMIFIDITIPVHFLIMPAQATAWLVRWLAIIDLLEHAWVDYILHWFGLIVADLIE